MYSDILGTRMTFKMQRRILPNLVWNQEAYGKRVLGYLKPGIRWLDRAVVIACYAADWRSLNRSLPSDHLWEWILAWKTCARSGIRSGAYRPTLTTFLFVAVFLI